MKNGHVTTIKFVFPHFITIVTFQIVLYHKNFPTLNFLVIQSILLVYIKIKKLERLMRNKGGLNSGENRITYKQEGSLLELNCSFKVTIPINLSSANQLIPDEH